MSEINGIELDDPATGYNIPLRTSLRRLALSRAPDPTELPDGTILRVSNGSWVAVPPATAPSNLAASNPTISQITLTWTAGDVTLETEVWKNDVLLTTVQDGTATYDATGLDPNTGYAFKIRHRVGALFSAFTAPLTAYTLPADISDAPTSSAQGETTLNVAWVNADATAKTRVYVDDGAGGAFVLFSTEAAGATTKQITGLTGNLPYKVKVKHEGAASALVSANFSSTLTQYTRPTDIVAAPTSGAQGATTIDIAWVNADATCQTEVQVDDGAGGAFSTFSTEAAAATTKQITGLTAETTYRIRVQHKGAVSTLLSTNPSPILTQATTA